MADHPLPVFVFRSARPGASFEFWLFRKLTPENRRLVLAYVWGFLPLWDASLHGGWAKRRGPDLFELGIKCSQPALRHRAQRPARPAGPLLAISVFFVRDERAAIVLSGAASASSALRGWPGTPGLLQARLLLRELRQAERKEYLDQRLVLDLFEEISTTGARAHHPPPRVSVLTADSPEILDLSGLREAVVREAATEGPEAVTQLAEYEDRFAIAAQVVRARLAARLTQRQLASMTGVRQHEVSRIENGRANPTLAKLGRLSRSLRVELRIGAGGPEEALARPGPAGNSHRRSDAGEGGRLD